MSWFSVGMHGNNAWHFHGSVGRLLSGEFVSDSVYDHGIHSNPLNLRIRCALTNLVSAWAVPKISPASKKIAKKVIEKTLTPEKLDFLKQRLREKYGRSSTQDLANFGKGIIKMGFKSVTSRFFGSNSKEITKNIETHSMNEDEKQAYNDKTIKLLKNGCFSDAALVFAEYMLLPVCEKAVQKALEEMTKAAAEKTYDLTIKKTCSLVVMPLMYSVFLMAIETLNQSYQTPMQEHLNYFPKPVTILSVTAAANAIHLGKCIWDESKNHQSTIDFDKEEVKNLAFEKAKKGLSQKLKDNELLSSLEMNKTQENVDHLVKAFVSEMVDFYWMDLHETKVLGLPLVA